jgi:hypothetical protein
MGFEGFAEVCRQAPHPFVNYVTEMEFPLRKAEGE